MTTPRQQFQEWRVLWADGLDEAFDEEDEARDWLAQWAGQPGAVSGVVQSRTVTVERAEWVAS